MSDLHDLLTEYFLRFHPALLQDEEAFEGLHNLVHALLLDEVRREKHRTLERFTKVHLS